jgi:hypothetical protein
MATPPPWTPAAKRILQALGAALLTAVTYKAAVLLVALPRHSRAPSFWLEVGTNLVIWVPCVAGGLVLLRGWTSGFHPFYALAALLLLGWTVLLCPYLYGMLGQPPYWVAYRNWPVGVAALALLVFAHLLSLRFVPPQPAGRHRLWLYQLGLLLGIAALYTFSCYVRQRVEQEAGVLVRRAGAAYAAGRHEEAVGEWFLVTDRYPYTAAWGEAVLGTGLYERERGHWGEAVARFESLLGGGLDDPDPSGYLAEPYRFCRLQACLELSSHYESRGDYRTALRYAVRARKEFPWQGGCGTCLTEIYQDIKERIDRLEQMGKGAR